MMQQVLKDIVENSFEGVIVIGNDYRITYMNRFAGEITGFSADEVLGKYCYEVLRAKRCKDVCPIKALKKGESLGEIVVDIIAKDNSEKYIKTKVFGSHGHWVEIFQDITREKELEKSIKGQYIFGDIITKDKGLIVILNQFPKIAESNVPILFEGESGVGKEVFAAAIQSLSQREGEAFVKINCASLPDTLLESELFGYKKGAFTDARKDKPGLFRSAHKGTLFLDEIGEMALPLQAKLLRAVETGEIIPLGAYKAEKVDVRLLAATNKNLLEEVEKGNFREDLFYRLNVVNIVIPALRERRNDIPLFIQYFIQHFNLIQQKNVTGMATDAMNVLLSHHYPGNIRELRNIMEYAFIFCGEGDIQLHHLPEYIKGRRTMERKSNAGEEHVPVVGPMTLKKFSPDGPSDEKEKLLEALESAHWNKKRAAQMLQIDRSTLWRKMKKYHIE